MKTCLPERGLTHGTFNGVCWMRSLLHVSGLLSGPSGMAAILGTVQGMGHSTPVQPLLFPPLPTGSLFSQFSLCLSHQQHLSRQKLLLQELHSFSKIASTTDCLKRNRMAAMDGFLMSAVQRATQELSREVANKKSLLFLDT